MLSTTNNDRRKFLQLTATGIVGAFASRMLPGLALAADKPAKSNKQFKKAVKIGMIGGDASLVEKFKMLKELGYDGVELDSPNNLARDEVLRARDESQLPIHGVVDSVHWRDNLAAADPAVRAKGLEGLKTALRDAQAYGASSVLLVPAVVGKDVSYDQAYSRSQAEIRKAIPLAAELEIKILFENVWNQFLLSPLEVARYIDEFDSPWVGAYFDVGNVVNYGWPEQWIRILGPRVVKLDIKEFSRKNRDQQGLWKGFECEIGEGDCDWPAVVSALDEIKFQGWATAEVSGGDRARLADIASRMDRVLAKPA